MSSLKTGEAHRVKGGNHQRTRMFTKDVTTAENLVPQKDTHQSRLAHGAQYFGNDVLQFGQLEGLAKEAT
jgi:hypothetical protein